MKIWGLGQISPEEKSDILSKHKHVYNGYKTMQPEVPNTQPLYVQDFANDKNGITVNNKGEVKYYTNMGINESVETKEVCDECGAMMMESECSECGWKGEVGDMEEGKLHDLGNKAKEFMKEPMSADVEEYIKRVLDIIDDPKNKDDDEKTKIKVGKEEMDEETGQLDDIHNVEDLGDAEFDYVEGGGNDYGTFEKMHHMKKIKSEGEYEDPDNEDDGFEDIGAYEEMEEGGYTGGGNAPDMDLSNIDPAYNFKSKGPEEGDGPFDVDADDMDLDEIKPAYNFETGGATNGGDAYPQYEEEMEEAWEKMESAWADDELEENDISGVQGVYLDMKKPYDFDSEGPGSAGPYQRSSYNEEDEEDMDDDEFDPKDKSWEEITAHTGDDEFSYLDEDIRESVIIQKNKINEMMLRMKVIK